MPALPQIRSDAPLSSVFANAAFTLRQAQGTTYDGDGERVKSVMQTDVGTTTTYFVGNHYELTDGVVTKYYYAGSQRIAMRKNGTLNYMVSTGSTHRISDHPSTALRAGLGSTSIVTDASGNMINQTQYKTWGEERYSSGTKQTNYGYTGQYSYAGDFGLQFYNARWYDSSLGRFTSADTVVPNGVQGLDRYAYVNNSPTNFTDPTGHHCEDEDIWGFCPSSYAGLSEDGKTAKQNLSEQGLLGDTQAALEYLVASEFNDGIINPNINVMGTQQQRLLEAVTNRFQTFCTGDSSSWSASCLNGFWAYHEPVLTNREKPTTYSSSLTWSDGSVIDQNQMITNMAIAIQAPGNGFYGSVLTSAAWNGGCQPGSGSANLCHYAEANKGTLVWNSFIAWGQESGRGMPYPVDAGWGEPWSYGDLHVWNNFGDLFFVSSQFAYDNYGYPRYK